MASKIEAYLPLSSFTSDPDAKLPVLAGTGLLIGLYILFKLLRIGSRDKRLPPGPSTLPIIGNLHQIPIKGIYKK
jgi:hypothetical protein